MTQINHTPDQFIAPYHVVLNNEPDNDNKGRIDILDNHGDMIGTAINERIAAQFAASSELLEALLLALPYVEEIHLVDAGAANQASREGYPDALKRANARLKETTEKVNSIKTALAKAGV